MTIRISRREWLSRVGATSLVLGASAGVARLCRDDGTLLLRDVRDTSRVHDFRFAAGKNDATPTMVVARSCQDPAELTRRAIAGLGGMKRFVSRGDIVALKPNIGWDRLPIHAANTNPMVVAELARLAFDAGAKEVVVTDASCNEAGRCFQRSGIWRVAHAAGATVILPAEHRFREMRLGGELLDRRPIYLPLIHADKVINVPVAKHHNLSKFTGGLKNWYGILGGRRNRLHQSIDVSIADLATFMRPTLTVMDATRVLMRNGPQGGNIDDAKDMHQVIAGLDPVAIDVYGAGLIGIPASQIKYLQMAQARGLGQTSLAAISIAYV